MRILNDEEIVKVYSGSETSFAADDPIRYGKAVARAQHQQDLKDFKKWLGKFNVSANHNAPQYIVSISDLESLK